MDGGVVVLKRPPLSRNEKVTCTSVGVVGGGSGGGG